MEASGPGVGDEDAGVGAEDGWIAPEIADEFPELRLLSIDVARGSGPSSPGVKHQLRGLSDRFRGSHAVTMRQDPVPWAYRVFYRHIGLDPDADRTPVEAAALERLIQGAFKSHNLLDDALTIALVETGVPIWALDGDRVEGALGIRATSRPERLGRDAQAPGLPAGRLVVADERSALAVLFGDLAPGHGVSPQTRRMRLFTVQVAGVPRIHVEEALYSCISALHEG